jgi:hypothetical protein
MYTLTSSAARESLEDELIDETRSGGWAHMELFARCLEGRHSDG